MLSKQEVQTAFATEFARSSSKLEAPQVVDSLSVGLSTVRDLVLARVHEDVEQQFGCDSMIAPMSVLAEEQQNDRAVAEIEIYSSIVVAEEIQRNRYLQQTESWSQAQLFKLRLNERQRILAKRVPYYFGHSVQDRRLKFITLLQKAVPESTRTPLVLFRLLPRAIRIVTAVAFGDMRRAEELRTEQLAFLPAVGDCSACHGRVLENDQVCAVCENPIWKFAWLQAE